MPACARLSECLRVLRDFLVASAGLRASQKLATGHRSPARTPALPLAVNMMFGGLFGGATKPAVGDISQVPGGWVNPEFMRGFTFDGASPAAPPPQGASSLGGVTADQLAQPEKKIVLTKEDVDVPEEATHEGAGAAVDDEISDEDDSVTTRPDPKSALFAAKMALWTSKYHKYVDLGKKRIVLAGGRTIRFRVWGDDDGAPAGPRRPATERKPRRAPDTPPPPPFSAPAAARGQGETFLTRGL